MDTRYLFFHTARAAVFQFYAFVLLLLALLYVKLSLSIPLATIAMGTVIYIGAVVFYAFHIDRSNRGNRGV